MGTVNHKGHKKLPPAPGKQTAKLFLCIFLSLQYFLFSWMEYLTFNIVASSWTNCYRIVALNELEVENFGLEDLEFEEEEEVIPVEGEKDIIVDEAEDERKKQLEEEAIKVFLGIKVDDMVKVTKKCKFFNEDGIVRRLKDGKIFLRFYTYGSMFEEWMDPEDVRKLTDTEVLKGLSGPTEPVTQRDFEEDSDEYDSDGRKKAGTFRRDLMSNMGGTQDRNRRQDRVGRGQFNRDFNGDETNRKKEEKNWDWYKENQRGDKGVVADDEYSYRPGSERDDALGDADAQWNRPPSQRQERRNKSDGDWSKFVSPASAPKKSGGEDDFFATLMTGLNKDLNTGDSGRSSSPAPESAEERSSSAGKEEDDFFASLMAEIDSAEDMNTESSSDADSSLLVDDFFASLDTKSKESSGETKSEAKDSSFNEDDLFDSFDVVDKKDEESGDFFSAFDLDDSKSKTSKAPEGEEDDFFASLEAELGNALDSEENTPSIDGNDDFFATLEKEVFADLNDKDDKSAEEKAPKGVPKSKAPAASAIRAPADGGEDLVKLTVPKLKEMLKAQGLKVGGKKAELIERLQEQQQ